MLGCCVRLEVAAEMDVPVMAERVTLAELGVVGYCYCRSEYRHLTRSAAVALVPFFVLLTLLLYC